MPHICTSRAFCTRAFCTPHISPSFLPKSHNFLPRTALSPLFAGRAAPLPETQNPSYPPNNTNIRSSTSNLPHKITANVRALSHTHTPTLLNTGTLTCTSFISGRACSTWYPSRLRPGGRSYVLGESMMILMNIVPEGGCEIIQLLCATSRLSRELNYESGIWCPPS